VTVGRERPAPDRARRRGRLRGDPRDPRGRRHRDAARGRVHLVQAERQRLSASASTASRAIARSSARTCCSRSGGVRTPTTSASTRAGVEVDARGQHQGRRAAATERAPASGRSATATGRGAFTHTAYNDFEIVADNLLTARRVVVTDRIDSYALYVDPAARPRSA
jgi:hypothetical protein